MPAIKKGPVLARVETNMGRLRLAAGFQKDQLPMGLIDAPKIINAAAAKDSVVLVFTGLVDKVPDDAQLATVLAHEVGHVLAQHSAEDANNQRGEKLGIFSSVLETVVSIGLAATGNGGIAISSGRLTSSVSNNVGYGVFVRKFDRNQELEADQIGLVLMARAGYDPRAAVAFWENAQAVFGEAATNQNEFYSTHPASSSRVERLQKIMPAALAEYKPVVEPVAAKSKLKRK